MGYRRFKKDASHPTCGEKCPLCGKPFLAGQFTTLIDQFPANIEELSKMVKRQGYTSEAVEVCVSCAEGIGFDIEAE